MTRTDLVIPAGPLRIVNVHTVAPVNRGRIAGWRRLTEAAPLCGSAPPHGQR
jgi:hypothetical protein